MEICYKHYKGKFFAAIDLTFASIVLRYRISDNTLQQKDMPETCSQQCLSFSHCNLGLSEKNRHGSNSYLAVLSYVVAAGY